jgi:hypothetical protein
MKEFNSINYCKRDNIVLLPFREFSNLQKRFLKFKYPKSNSFFKNIRQYNFVLIFISIAYISNRRLDIYTYNSSFQIQNELHYLQNSLISRYKEDPTYAQYFIYDPDKIIRLYFIRNINFSQSFLRELNNIIR